jgi:signal transduction histidine kinase
VKTSLDVTGRPRRLAPVIENNLLRAGQEAITNATKHAQAGSIAVKLEFGEKHLQLVVQDDGRGFDASQPPASVNGFGLVGLRERATELRGELHLRSAPGQGTEIILNVPLSDETGRKAEVT